MSDSGGGNTGAIGGDTGPDINADSPDVDDSADDNAGGIGGDTGPDIGADSPDVVDPADENAGSGDDGSSDAPAASAGGGGGPSTGQMVAAGAAVAAAGGVAAVAASAASSGGSGGSGDSAAGGAAAAAGGATAAGGMAASLVSAIIQCLDAPFPPIEFPFNPDSYTEIVEGKWKSSVQPATGGPTPQWLGVVPQKVTVKILLDEFAIPPPIMPLEVVVAQLKKMVLPSALSLGMRKATAPRVMFMWGSNIIMDEAYIAKVAITYERFFLGNPVRATAAVDLQAIPLPSPLGATNPTSGGVATRRTRTMVEGDTLASIAYQEYKDANLWRALAEANRIDDPMRVPAGTVIAVPDRREADNLS